MEKSAFFSPISVPMVLMIYCISTIVDSTFTTYASQADVRIKDAFTYTVAHSTSLPRCAALCAHNGSCMSVAFNEQGASCKLSAYRIYGVEYQNRLTSGTSWKALSKRCLNGWTMVGHTCYLFSTEVKTFDQAEAYCLDAGGKLAEPRTNATYQLLVDHMVNSGDVRSYYFGMTDRDAEGKFVWISDGTEPTYTVWIIGNPENGFNADCNIMAANHGFKWGDEPCHLIYHPLCEI